MIFKDFLDLFLGYHLRELNLSLNKIAKRIFLWKDRMCDKISFVTKTFDYSNFEILKFQIQTSTCELLIF